ncbi:MAG TPA: aspartate/glutamate racemase family protein [Chloroflexota bacterium]
MATVGVIRVLTTDDPDFLSAHGRIIERRFGLKTVNRCIPDQWTGIYDDASEAIAVPKIIRLGTEMAADGVDAIVVSCAADPAVSELRAALKIPVIGAGSAASAVALSQADRVGVLNLNETAPGPVRRILGDCFVGEDAPEGVENSPQLLTDWGKQAALEAAKRLARLGAGSIVLACTGYGTIGMAGTLREQLGLVAVDPVVAAGLMASYALA